MPLPDTLDGDLKGQEYVRILRTTVRSELERVLEWCEARAVRAPALEAGAYQRAAAYVRERLGSIGE